MLPKFSVYAPHPFWLIALVLLVMLPACNLNSATGTPVPTPDLPVVEILSPANNSSVIEFVDFGIDIVARDAGRGVAKIELYVDGEKINEAIPESNLSEPVFRVEMNWVSQGLGFHVISAIAYRMDGTPSDEFILNIEVIERSDEDDNTET